METIWLFAGIVLVTVYFLDRERLQFDLKAFTNFLKIVLIGSSLSIALNTVLGRIPPLLPVEASSLLFVWWEDVLFSLLFIYYAEKLLPRWAFYIVAVISSVVFGLGHLYQGWLAAILVSFYPYFISYKYGKKHGFMTIMVCHVVFDLVIYGNTYILQFLKSLL